MVKYFTALVLFFSIQLNAQNKTIDLAVLKDIDGKAIVLDAKTEKVFLYYWAYWCPECEEKFTKFFPENIEKIKIPILTVNTDSKENKVRGFIEKHKIKLAVIMDLDKSLRKSASVNGVPGWALLIKQPNGQYLIQESKVGFEVSEVKKILDLK